MDKISREYAPSSIYSQEDESSEAAHENPSNATEGHDVEAASNQDAAEQQPKAVATTKDTPDDPTAEPPASQEESESTPSENPSEALSLKRQGPDENLVDFINRKLSARIARHRAEKEAIAARDAKEREERELALSKPPPPGPRAPNPEKDFNPRPPGTMSSCSRGPARFYTKAHVLTVHWSAMCPGLLPASVKQLKEVIRKYYGYEVTHCALPAHRDAPQVLAQALAEVVNMYGGNAKDTLIILHYVGHSRTDATSFRICPPALAFCPAAIEVDLHALLCDTILTPAFNPDVLCLFDCAYALENMGRPCEGKEILAASTEPSRFTIRDRSAGGGFTRSIATKLEEAMGSMQFYTDELEERLIKEAEPKTWSFGGFRCMFGEDNNGCKKRKVTLPRIRAASGLRTGMGPPLRHIFLAPLVTPWQYWRMKNEPRKKGWLEAEDVDARCFICGRLSMFGGFAHKHMCGRVPVCGVRGHTYDVAKNEVELDEVVKRRPQPHPVAAAA